MNAYLGGGSIVAFSDYPSAASEAPPTKAKADAQWLDYCRTRELAERAAAKSARSVEARRVHQELAQAYMLMREGCR